MQLVGDTAMMNIHQMATFFCLAKQRGSIQSATEELIYEVFGQVQAFISNDATPQMAADQTCNTLRHLRSTRSDAPVDLDTLNAWAESFTE